jgi:peptide/nickel transport system permease protein
MSGVVRGDLGVSYVQQQPVAQLIAERIPVTGVLALMAFGMSIGGAALLAIVSRRGRIAAGAVRLVEYAAFAFPQFWLALVLVWLFGFRWRWFPVFGYDGLHSLVLPAVALSLGNAAILSRTVRAELTIQEASNHALAAAALGLPRRRVLLVHLLPLAVIPALALLAIQAGYLLAGAIVVEEVFGLPGLGRLALSAISQRDLPVVQGVVLIFGTVFPFFSTLADLLVALLWPRLRGESAS